jgi:hypothetical protein
VFTSSSFAWSSLKSCKRVGEFACRWRLIRSVVSEVAASSAVGNPSPMTLYVNISHNNFPLMHINLNFILCFVICGFVRVLDCGVLIETLS